MCTRPGQHFRRNVSTSATRRNVSPPLPCAHVSPSLMSRNVSPSLHWARRGNICTNVSPSLPWRGSFSGKCFPVADALSRNTRFHGNVSPCLPQNAYVSTGLTLSKNIADVETFLEVCFQERFHVGVVNRFLRRGRRGNILGKCFPVTSMLPRLCRPRDRDVETFSPSST